MSPFFLRQYVKGHANDVFEPYPQLLTEMALRLPYQVHKNTDSSAGQPAFEQVLIQFTSKKLIKEYLILIQFYFNWFF